jgi:hypothetical protein
MGGWRGPRLRVGLVAALLFGASACNFSIAGISGSSDTSDAGTSPPIGGPAPDLAAPPKGSGDMASASGDLATSPTPADMTTTPLPTQIGDACSGSCAAGLTCMNWVPAGYCSETCDGSANSCPPGSTCADTGGGARYCLLNEGGGCMRNDLKCRDCGSSVCAPANFCSGC